MTDREMIIALAVSQVISFAMIVDIAWSLKTFIKVLTNDDES